jgi:hypothetical protein
VRPAHEPGPWEAETHSSRAVGVRDTHRGDGGDQKVCLARNGAGRGRLRRRSRPTTPAATTPPATTTEAKAPTDGDPAEDAAGHDDEANTSPARHATDPAEGRTLRRVPGGTVGSCPRRR